MSSMDMWNVIFSQSISCHVKMTLKIKLIKRSSPCLNDKIKNDKPLKKQYFRNLLIKVLLMSFTAVKVTRYN